MNKKGLFLLLTSSTLAISWAVALSLNSTMPITQSAHVASADPENTIRWTGEIVTEHESKSTGYSGTCGYEDDGFHFNVTKTNVESPTDWFVKLANYNLDFDTTSDYFLEVKFYVSHSGDVVINGVTGFNQKWADPGNNTRTVIFRPNAAHGSLEFMFGKVNNKEGFEAVVKEIKLMKTDKQTFASANEGHDVAYTINAPELLDDNHKASLTVTSVPETGKEAPKVKLQASSSYNFENDKQYFITYTVESSSAGGVEITYYDQAHYGEKWLLSPDGVYSDKFSLAANTPRTVEFFVTSNKEVHKNIGFSVRPGLLDAGTTSIYNLYIVNVTDGEAVSNGALSYANDFAVRWRALRNDGNICVPGANPFAWAANESQVGAMISEYDSQSSGRRSAIDAMTDVGDYTIGQSIAYFRAKLGL